MVELILILVSLVVKNVTGERDERDVLDVGGGLGVLDVRGVTCVWGTADPTPRTLSPVPSPVPH